MNQAAGDGEVTVSGPAAPAGAVSPKGVQPTGFGSAGPVSPKGVQPTGYGPGGAVAPKGVQPTGYGPAGAVAPKGVQPMGYGPAGAVAPLAVPPMGYGPTGAVAPLAVAPMGYGPTALATPANALTVVRLLAAPLLVIMVLQRPTSWLTWAVWVALAGTDGIDGWLARRHGTTRSGAFLDPLADKFLVLGAMFALVAAHRFSWIPVTIIAGREVTISLYRVFAAHGGVSVPARALAKVKTVVQAFAVGAIALPVTGSHPVIAVTLLWVAMVLTVVTGAHYLLLARRPGAMAGAGPPQSPGREVAAGPSQPESPTRAQPPRP